MTSPIQKSSELLSRRFDTPDQAFFTRTVSQPFGSVVAVVAHALRLSPNAVTILGLVVMLSATAVYAWCDGWQGALWAAALFQLGFAFDCADGQLARATRRQSPFGAWLDVSCDHIRQGCICLALTVVVSTVAGYLCAALLMAGLSVYLHTVMSIKVTTAPPMNLSGSANHLRFILREWLDTPLFLLVICGLRAWPELLLAYIASYGLLSLARAASLAKLRLARAA